MKRVVLVLLCALSIIGCSVRETVPTLDGIQLPKSRIDAIRTALNTRRDRIHDIKSLVRVRLRSGNESNSFRYAVVYRRPSALRIEVFPVNGFYTISLLGVLNDSLVSVVPNEREAYIGTPSRDVLKKVLGLPLMVEEIAGLLLAEPSSKDFDFIGMEEGEEIRYLSEDKRIYFETHRNSDEIQRVKLFNEDKKLIAEAAYSEYKVIQGVSFPHNISLRFIEADVAAELRIQKLQINASPSDELFSINVPEGFSTSQID